MDRLFTVSLCAFTLACTNDSPSDTGSDDVVVNGESESESDSSGDSSSDTETSSTDSSSDDTDTSGSDSEESESGTDGPIPDMGVPIDPNELIPPTDEEGCHGIFAQDVLPTFDLTLQPVVWALLVSEWNNGEANEDMGLNPNPFHPVQAFRYDDIEIFDAEIRLRGNPSNWDPVPGDKMQFQINFHRNDPEGHFLGLRRLALDAATYNRHMLRDRLALAVMRDAGIAAPCANSARVVINGEYYGLFTNIEKIDEVYLERAWEDPSGDLWKRASWELKTNLETANDDHIDALDDAETLAEVEANLDLMQALQVYAADSIIPNSDGPWAGGLNYYFYDDPITGKFQLLPWDLDNTFDRFDDPPNGIYPVNPDPVVFEKPNTWGRPWYDLALQDPQWFAYYVSQVDHIVHEAYNPEEMLDRIDTWTEQIQPSVFEDVNKPFSNAKYLSELEELYWYVEQRYTWVDEWMACWNEGGTRDLEGYCVP